MKIIKQIRWKALLSVFKIRRFVNKWLGVRRLDYDNHDIFISTDTIREYETRAQSVCKEPETVSWIEKYGGSNAVLYDIGANIGAYSLIAAARGAKVIAFEPAPQNIYKLNKNIFLNGLNKDIMIMPFVLTKNNCVIQSIMTARDRDFGSSHTFSSQEQLSDSLLKQTFVAMELDTCIKVFSLSEPTMIKIDVDGAEIEVLKGAKTLLASPKLKSILIEIDDKNTEIAKSILEDAGFKIIEEKRICSYAANCIFERV